MPASPQSHGPPFLIVLGTAQDGGYPQAGCRKACCERAWTEPRRRRVVSLGIVDRETGQRWLVDCTPDFREQLRELDGVTAQDAAQHVDGILFTHAHVGHYAGLIHLGREAMATRRVRVHAMPRMRQFLENNQPWRQLVTEGNITLRELADGCEVALGERIGITPFPVPHRDEFSETVGYRIQGPGRSALYLPDVDSWDGWERTIEDHLRDVDIAFLDGTFYSSSELPGRDVSQIPHPRITDSIGRFARLPESERNKIRFLHFNHTNPVLDPESGEARSVRDAGCHLAEEGRTWEL